MALRESRPPDGVERRTGRAPPCSGDVSAGNLPTALTTFIGRSAELARARELLSETRLLTLVGAGGCGKTRLALETATADVASYPAGAWWVELAPLEDPDLLATTVVAALGLRERPGKAPVEVLQAHLRERPALLVLDNCEHLVEPCAELVHDLLSACEPLVVAATSREALGVRGESHYRVPSMELPGESDSLEAVASCDAVRLFCERAADVRPSFSLTDENVGAVATICRGLDGIPLAIELAAARVRVLSVDRIAEQLDDRFHLLSEGGRSAPDRHQTLRDSIEWSHELCSEGERLLLGRLSVFTGGWTLEGAEAVCACEAVGRREVLDLLTGLVDKSLVDTEEHGDEIRFRMLATIRQFAAERLVEAGERDSTRDRHLTWYVGLVEHTEPELVRHDARRWLDQLALEDANLRSALEWGLRTDCEAALRLAGALTFLWLVRGRLSEGTTALGRVLERAPEPSGARGKALWGLAYLNIWRGRFDACLEYAERALEDGEAADDPSVMARALAAKGHILSLPDHLKGRSVIERSVERARAAGDEWCTAEATRLLARTYVRQSDHERARPILEESYELARALGSRPLYAWYFNSRATGELEHGRLRAARELAEQAVALSGEVGDPVTLGTATSVLTECDVLQGLPGEGRARAEPFMELVRSTGARSAEPWVQSALALADVAEGMPDKARERIDAVLPLLEGAPGYDQVWQARRARAVALLALGELDEAEEAARRLLSHAEIGDNDYVRVLALHLLGRAALARDAVREAEAHLHEALAIAARRDFRRQTLATLESLAQVAALTGSAAEAARLLGAAEAARAESGSVRWPPAPDVWDSVEAGLRAELGDAEYVTAWGEGAALGLEQAVAYATRSRGARKRPSRGWESLTPTELDVVRHAAEGLTNPQIGERMFISRATVKAHLSHIYAKLGLSSRSELAAEAAKRGLDSPEKDGSGR